MGLKPAGTGAVGSAVGSLKPTGGAAAWADRDTEAGPPGTLEEEVVVVEEEAGGAVIGAGLFTAAGGRGAVVGVGAERVGRTAPCGVAKAASARAARESRGMEGVGACGLRPPPFGCCCGCCCC